MTREEKEKIVSELENSLGAIKNILNKIIKSEYISDYLLDDIFDSEYISDDNSETESEIEPTTKNNLVIDCVPRDIVRRIIKSPRNKEQMLSVLESVKEVQPRKGHWVYDFTGADGHRNYHCSECGCDLKPKHSEPLSSFKWCSSCGAKMDESEDKK